MTRILLVTESAYPAPDGTSGTLKALVDRLVDLFYDRMETLPIFAYYSYQQPGFGEGIQASYDRSWAASLTLMLVVMVLFGLARVLASVLKPKGLK